MDIPTILDLSSKKILITASHNTKSHLKKIIHAHTIRKKKQLKYSQVENIHGNFTAPTQRRAEIK